MANDIVRSDLRRAVAVIPISFTAGNDTIECCREALRIAVMLDVSVEWTMNGVRMFATRSMDAKVLHASYESRHADSANAGNPKP